MESQEGAGAEAGLGGGGLHLHTKNYTQGCHLCCCEEGREGI